MNQNYNWPAYCRKYGITAEELKAIASDLGLPMAKLSDRDSKRLLHELEARCSVADEVVEQQTLFKKFEVKGVVKP